MISSKQAEIHFPIRGRLSITSRRFNGRKVRYFCRSRKMLLPARIVRLPLVRRSMLLSGRRANHRIWRKKFSIFQKRDNCKFQNHNRSRSKMRSKFCCIVSMKSLILVLNMSRKQQQSPFVCQTLLER